MKNILTNSSAAFVLGMTLSTCGFDDLKNNPPVTPLPPLYNWSSQNSQSNAKLYDVFFVSNSQGWVVGESLTLLATTNGGSNWPQVPTNSIVRDLRSVFFIDSQTGWMTGGSDANPPDGRVFISKMGGAYPTQQDKVDRPLNTVFFLDENNGWAAGDSSILIHTDNGGMSWSKSAIGTNDKIFDLHFFTSEMGWAATDQGGIYRTKDGITWKKEDVGSASDVRAIHFVDTLHGWACGSGNTIFRRQLDLTNNVIWITSTIAGAPAGAVWHDIFFIDQQKGWVVGSQGQVYRSTDGRTTWTQETAGATGDFNAIFMVSSAHGWIVGDNGNILTYTP